MEPEIGPGAPEVDFGPSKIDSKSDLELQESLPEPIPLPDPCWIDFGRIFVGLLAQLGAILGGKLGHVETQN